MIEDFIAIFKHIRSPGYTFHVAYDSARASIRRERPYLQVGFVAPDSDTGQPSTQRGRKWLLSHHMTHSEVVQTAFKAVLTAVEHEVRESFTYKGCAIFGPHYDIERLVALCKGDHKEVRRRLGAVASEYQGSRFDPAP